MTNLTQFLNAAADTRPNAGATIMGTRKRNWHEHRERVAKLADSLRKLGASAGDRVAILALNSDRYTESHTVHSDGYTASPQSTCSLQPESSPHIQPATDASTATSFGQNTCTGMDCA